MKLSEEQHKLIKRIAAENDLSDFQLVESSGSGKGDNFLGIVKALTLTGKKKTLELILKSAQRNEAFRNVAPIHAIYDREIYLYKRVFEEFEKFQEDNNIADPFNSTAKFYGYCANDVEECVVMENLKTEGYQLWDKRVPMNPEHVRAVLMEYAKFHAVSFAMKQKNPKLFDDLTESIGKFVFDEDKFMEHGKHVFQGGYEALKDDVELFACFERAGEKLEDLYATGFKSKEFKLVISHGDCWCNNFLFKYQDSKDLKTPSSLRILDWQLSSLTSPAHDICYFLLTNSCQEVFDNFESYLNLYYDTLKMQLENFNCDVEELFPNSTYRDHVKKFMVFGIQMSISILKLALCDPEDAPDFEKNANVMEKINMSDKNMESYRNRLSMIIRFVNDNKFV